MENYKKDILDKICYTELVYGRINNKLNIELSNNKIEEMIFAIINETDETEFKKTGKNIYITNNERNIRLTINSYTNRIITVDKLNKKTTYRYHFGFNVYQKHHLRNQTIKTRIRSIRQGLQRIRQYALRVEHYCYLVFKLLISRR